MLFVCFLADWFEGHIGPHQPDKRDNLEKLSRQGGLFVLSLSVR